MKKKVILIIQARMNSSRMPGKIMSKICDRPVIDYLIERVNRCRYIDDIVIATSTNELDDQIVSYCVKKSINYYRGSELDVLNRYYQASKQFKADIIVRITSDCPLIDPVIIDQVIQTYIQSKNQYDFISNTVPPPSNYPDGMDVEVFSYELLEKANFQSKLPSQREHVTFFMWKDNNFKTLKIDSNENFGKYRLTLDYQEDFEVIKAIIESIYQKNNNFSLKDIIVFLDNNKKYYDLNKKFVRNASWEKSFINDKNY